MNLFITEKIVEKKALGHVLKAEIYHEFGHDIFLEESLKEALKKAMPLGEYKRALICSSIKFDQYLLSDEDKTKPELQEYLTDGSKDLYNALFIGRFTAIIEKLTLCRMKDRPISHKIKDELVHLFALLPEEPLPLIKIQKQAILIF